MLIVANSSASVLFFIAVSSCVFVCTLIVSRFIAAVKHFFKISQKNLPCIIIHIVCIFHFKAAALVTPALISYYPPALLATACAFGSFGFGRQRLL